MQGMTSWRTMAAGAAVALALMAAAHAALLLVATVL